MTTLGKTQLPLCKRSRQLGNMLVPDLPLRASHPRRRLLRVQPIALEDSADPEFTDDGIDEASELHFLPPAPDSPVPSLCETSREETGSPQPTSPSPEITFDVFMSELEDKAESPPLKPASPFQTRYHMRVSIIRREAAQREFQRSRRQQAAARIQRWFLRIITQVKARRALESKLIQHINAVKVIQAARRVVKAVRKFAEMRRMAKREVWRRYREVCAVLIQKWVRGFAVKKRYLRALKLRYDSVRWLIIGLKVRRVLKVPEIRTIREQIVSCCDPEEYRNLRKAFISAFSLHLRSPWKHLASRSPVRRPFLLRGRSRKEAHRPEPSSPPPVTRSVSSSWAGIRQRQQSTCPAIVQKQEKRTISKRETIVISQKPTWTKTKSRIDCWNSPKKTPSFDFPKVEKAELRPNRKKIRIPLSENDCIPDSSGTTEAPSVAETCKPSFSEQSSLIPRLQPCSAFVVSLRAVDDCKALLDIRRLLQEAFEIIKRD